MDTKEYHCMVWGIAEKEARGLLFSDKKILAGNIILAISSGYATSRILDYWSNSTMIPPIIQFIAILLGTVVGFVLLYGFNLGWNGFWEVPSRLFSEKQKEANKYTWNDVSITIDPLGPNDPISAHLLVLSGKDIQKLCVQVNSLRKNNYFVPESKFPANLAWSTDDGWLDQINLRKDNPITVFVGSVPFENDNPMLITRALNDENVYVANPYTLEFDSHYIVELEWFGEIDGHKMDKHTTSYKLYFSGRQVSFQEIE